MTQTGLDVRVSYDPTNDVAYFSFGEPKEGISVEASDGIIVRFDPETDKPIGVTVIDFSKRFLEHPGTFLPLIPQDEKLTPTHA